jgi:hypothetical protein
VIVARDLSKYFRALDEVYRNHPDPEIIRTFIVTMYRDDRDELKKEKIPASEIFDAWDLHRQFLRRSQVSQPILDWPQHVDDLRGVDPYEFAGELYKYIFSDGGRKNHYDFSGDDIPTGEFDPDAGTYAIVHFIRIFLLETKREVRIARVKIHCRQCTACMPSGKHATLRVI